MYENVNLGNINELILKTMIYHQGTKTCLPAFLPLISRPIGRNKNSRSVNLLDSINLHT